MKLNASLQLIGLSLLLSSSALADDQNTFSSLTVGFTVTKPASWQFFTAEQNLENLKRVDMGDKQFQELVTKYATAPLVMMAKYPEPYDDLNPSFKVNIKPLGRMKGQDPKKILGAVVKGLKRMFKDLRMVQPPSDTTVSGLNAAHMRVDYSLSIPDGRSFPTASEMWIVPRGDYLFMIGTGTRQDEKTGTRAAIQTILKTVKIDK